MNRYKRSAARSEPHTTLNNTDDGIYFVTNNGSNPKVPNIISRNQSRRSVSNSTNNSIPTMSTACLSQNQNQIIVEESVVQEQQLHEGQQQQLPGVDGGVQELPLQEVTTEQHVQIIQHPQDENNGLMYFLLEDGTLAQIDTSEGTHWLNNSNIELQFDEQQQQYVVGEETIEQVEHGTSKDEEDLCPCPENEMLEVDSHVKQGTNSEQLVVESEIEQQHQVILDSEQESNFEQQKENVDSILQQEEDIDLQCQETQRMDLEDLVEEEEMTVDSSLSMDEKQLNLQVLSANQQALNLQPQDQMSDLIQQDNAAVSEEHLPLEDTSQMRTENEDKQAEQVQGLNMDHDGEGRSSEQEEDLNSAQQQHLLLEPVVKEDDQQQPQQQQEEQNSNNPDQESYFLLQINGQTLLLPMSSLSDQNTILDENNQEINIMEQFQCGNVTDLSSDNSFNPSMLQTVPSDVSGVNLASDDDSRPKPFRFVLPSPASADADSFIRVKGENSPNSTTTTHQPQSSSETQEDVNEQPPIKRFKEGQSEEVKTELTRKTPIIRPGVGGKMVVSKSSIGSKTKMTNPCLYRCGACHQLYSTKELALQHMVEVHKADPRTTKTQFRALESPKHHSCSKCGNMFASLELLHKHSCMRGVSSSINFAGKSSSSPAASTLASSLTRFDGSLKTKLNHQLEIEKQSDSSVEMATNSRQPYVYASKVSSSNNNINNNMSLLKSSATSLTYEDQNTTTMSSTEQNSSSNLRVIPSSQLNFPPSLICCDRTFVSLYYYLQHRLIHTRESNSSDPWQCEVCQIEFLAKQELLAHFFSHTSDYIPPRKRKSKILTSTNLKKTENVKQTMTPQVQNNSDDKNQISHDLDSERRRGRGRQPQDKSFNDSSSSSTSSSISNKVERKQQQKDTTAEVKRGRGRPKKSLDDKQDATRNVKSTVERKPPGRRPRPVMTKKNKSDGDNNQLSIKKEESTKLGDGSNTKRGRTSSPDILTSSTKVKECDVVDNVDKASSSSKSNALMSNVEDNKQLDDGLNISNQDSDTSPKRRGRKPKNIDVKVVAEATKNSVMTSNTMTRRSMRNVSSAISNTRQLTNGNYNDTPSNGENSPKSKMRGTRLRCSTDDVDNKTIVSHGIKKQQDIIIKSISSTDGSNLSPGTMDSSKGIRNSSKLQSNIEIVNGADFSEDNMMVVVFDATPDSQLVDVQKQPSQATRKSMGRARKRKDETTEKLVGNQNVIIQSSSSSNHLISGNDGLVLAKKSVVKVQTTANRRHKDELMRTPASQKRVQDSFVEIFKRVKRNSAEESIINKNGGVGSSKLAKLT